MRAHRGRQRERRRAHLNATAWAWVPKLTKRQRELFSDPRPVRLFTNYRWRPNPGVATALQRYHRETMAEPWPEPTPKSAIWVQEITTPWDDPTLGDIIAREAREACNNLSREERDRLLDRAFNKL